MKNLLIKKGLFFSLIALGFIACDEDIHNFTKTTESEASNSIYIADDDALFTYPIFWNLEGKLITEVDTVLAKFPVFLAKPSEKDVVVTLEMDNELVEIYNMKHGTNYGFILPQNVEISNANITIPAGKTISLDSVSVAYTRPVSSLNAIGGYLIPIKIANYKGTDVKINYDERHCYLTADVINENEVYFKDGSESVTAINIAAQNMNVNLYSRYVIQGQEDAKVQLSVNNNLIETFNAERGSEYQPIPSGLAASYEATINKGASDAIFTIDYSGDISALSDPRGYVVPLEMTSVSGDAAINVQESGKVFYLIIFSVPAMTNKVLATEVEVGGTVVEDKSKFALVGTPLYVDGSNPGATNTGFPRMNGQYIIMPYGSTVQRPINMTIDLGAEYQNITGLQLGNLNPNGHVNNVSTLDISFVGEKMYEMGMSAVSAGTVEASAKPKNLYIKFNQPITARYLMLNNMYNGGAAQLWLNNFNIFTQP